MRLFFPPCLFHWLTGYYCPGCGGTRAVLALLRGHFLRSFLYHPLVPYTAFALSWLLLSCAAEKLAGRPLPLHFPRRPAWLWTALAIVVVNCAVKNLALWWGVDLLGLSIP